MSTRTPKRAIAKSPQRQKPEMRYLRGDRSGILAMRRALTRDAKTDVMEAAERASALAMDFLHNSGWISGAADQIVADTIGSELKLNARPDLAALGYDAAEQTAWCRLVEAEWRRWAWNPAECDLAGKMTVPEMLDAVVRTYLAYGEAIGVFDFITIPARKLMGLTTGTKVSLVAPHRLPRTTREFEGLDQGIFHDARGRILAYRFRTRETGIDVDRDIMASDVIHVMDRGQNASSPRGISVVAPALKVLAQYDQLADATLATALMQTIFAATIKSPEASDEAFQAIKTLGEEFGDYEGANDIAQDLIDVWGNRINALKEKGISMSDPARINHLGPGEEFQMHTASTPGSQYLPFSQNLQREMARCLGITFESLSLDHSDASYSTVRMAVSTIWPVTTRRRDRVAGPFAQALYERWLEDGIAERRIPLKGGYQAFLANRQRVVWAEWRGPERPTADPYKDALADKVKLEMGATTLQRIYAAQGLDWEEEVGQAGLEIEKLTSVGMPIPHGRSQGGSGGPLGGAADGRRDAAGETVDG